jgi:NAD+ synthase (glutamine-hydrolysing)
MDTVMSGHAVIAESGRIIAEREPFAYGKRLTIADIDTAHLTFDRLSSADYPNTPIPVNTTSITSQQNDLDRAVEPHPFTPHGSPETVAERYDGIMAVQAIGLAERLKSTGIDSVVLGVSGGLDSTLALLAAERAARHLGRAPGDMIEAITMPSRANSKRTQNNAVRLAEALGIPSTVIPICDMTAAQIEAIGHGGSEDVTFQNTQARLRTALLFNHANQSRALVLGTGDLSEIALGWSTFGGDHLSHYNVNAGVPKTLVKHLVRRGSELVSPEARDVLIDILDTPISPELIGDGSRVSQKTEDILGPYELHDFFLYHFVRYQDPADKISYMAKQAFNGVYSAEQIDTCLDIFIKRFYTNQWKRSCMPDGPKVGTVSLSPRGDWRMPSDGAAAARQQLARLGTLE